MTFKRHTGRGAVLGAVLCSAALALAACGGDDDSSGDSSPRSASLVLLKNANSL